ncbi:MAG: hypothetical protein CMM50_06750 [Rhodospirillaceae bacterium]|nr:hypothetical protein [Rhodospirillaceae bacterium]
MSRKWKNYTSLRHIDGFRMREAAGGIMVNYRNTLIAAFVGLVGWLGMAPASMAEPTFVGPEKCQECHKEEHKVWEGTKHFESFREVHRAKGAREIAEATGERNMRRSDVCTICHYTVIDDRAEAGPSCESCHGPASEWIEIHNDYGGKEVKREQETPEHKAERMAKAAAAGMIWPTEKFDVAMNCNGCHGLANPKLSGENVALMLDNDHPIKPDWNLVAYSQGSVRHRFYPPDVNTNQKMSEPELARLFVTGKIAKLLSATQAMGKTDHAKYVEAQQARIADAKSGLAPVSVPEVQAFVGDPTEDNARNAIAAIEDKDLTGEVGGMLPPESAYK